MSSAQLQRKPADVRAVGIADTTGFGCAHPPAAARRGTDGLARARSGHRRIRAQRAVACRSRSFANGSLAHDVTHGGDGVGRGVAEKTSVRARRSASRQPARGRQVRRIRRQRVEQVRGRAPDPRRSRRGRTPTWHVSSSDRAGTRSDGRRPRRARTPRRTAPRSSRSEPNAIGVDRPLHRCGKR